MTVAGDLTEEWNSFLANSKQGNLILSETFEDKGVEDDTPTTINKLPKCNDIYISTKTKQAVLSQSLDYINIFYGFLLNRLEVFLHLFLIYIIFRFSIFIIIQIYLT